MTVISALISKLRRNQKGAEQGSFDAQAIQEAYEQTRSIPRGPEVFIYDIQLYGMPVPDETYCVDSPHFRVFPTFRIDVTGDTVTARFTDNRGVIGNPLFEIENPTRNDLLSYPSSYEQAIAYEIWRHLDDVRIPFAVSTDTELLIKLPIEAERLLVNRNEAHPFDNYY